MKKQLFTAALVLFAIAPFAAHAAPCGVTTGKSASTLLLYFARTGDARNVRCLLDNGADANVVNSAGVTALMSAAGAGRAEVVRVLLEKGAEVNAVAQDGTTALVLASRNGHADIVRLLTGKGASVDVASETSTVTAAPSAAVRAAGGRATDGAPCDTRTSESLPTPLLYSAGFGNTKNLTCLLDNGADVNAINDKTGGTALMAAARAGNTNAVRLLIERGADVNAVDKEDNTALKHAARIGHTDVARVLLEKGADVNAVTQDSLTVRILAARKDKELAGIVRLLMEHGAQLDIASPGGVPAQDSAAGHHNEIAASPCDTRTSEASFPTPLLYSTRNGNIKNLRCLLEHGADVNAMDNKTGYSALMVAGLADQAEAARLLIEKGANINAISTNEEGVTALMLAMMRGRLMRSATQEIDNGTGRLLIEKGADVNIADKNCNTALMFAVKTGRANIVRMLIKKGADVNVANKNGITALRLAQAGKDADIEKMLRKAGAVLDAPSRCNHKTGRDLPVHAAAPNPPNRTGCDSKADKFPLPLLYSARHGDTKNLRCLLDNGADVHTVDQDGTTALMLAASEGHADAVRLLLEKGADIHATDKWHATALRMAQVAGHSAIVEMLRAAGAK